MKRSLVGTVAVLVAACGAAATPGPVETAAETGAATSSVRAARDGVVWEASSNTVRRTQPVGPSVALPAGAEIFALEVGYDGTVFASDRGGHTIYAVRDSRVEVLAEGEQLAGPGPLVLQGGRLLVGASDGLYGLDLKSGDYQRLAQTPSIVGMAVDHVGYFVVRTAQPGQLLRVTPDGKLTALDAPVSGAGAIRYDATARRLHVDGDDLDYLELTGEDAEVWKVRDARPMQPFERNGIVLSGAEYWPNRGDQPTSYPDDVLWGFYPEQGVVFEGEASRATPTAAAMSCAHTAYERLRAWVENAPVEFFEAARLLESNRFYLWVNDYSEASDPFPHEMRMNKFWYWQREPAVIGRVPGYWKWESTVTQTGACLTPDAQQIETYLRDKLAALRSV